MTGIHRWLACLAVALWVAPAVAQPPEPPFMAELFPPELIMRHGRDIGLTEEQRGAITKAVGETQARVLELQWDMQELAQTLTEELSRDRVDEKAALAAAARVMELESQVKRAHLGLLIRIKNQLDAEQQARLRELRGPPRDSGAAGSPSR